MEASKSKGYRTDILDLRKMNQPYLELIFGNMFSGKTSYLIEVYKMNNICEKKQIVINYENDNRYDDKLLSTHDKIKIPCIKSSVKLFDTFIGDLKEEIEKSDNEIVLINEGQFFQDLIEFVDYLIKLKKKIYICGLDGDFKREKFGYMTELIPIADNYIKLRSLCVGCKNGTKASFSKRISNENEQTIIGSDNYIPVCRECFDKD
jgi:thymidine kinase